MSLKYGSQGICKGRKNYRREDLNLCGKVREGFPEVMISELGRF